MKKKNLLIILYIISILVMIFWCIKFISSIFSAKDYEIIIDSKNKQEIVNLISTISNNPEKVTKIKFHPIYGDGKLYLYEGIKKYDIGIIYVNDEITQYIYNNGKEVNSPYFLYFLFSIIIFLFLKSIIDDDTQKNINN